MYITKDVSSHVREWIEAKQVKPRHREDAASLQDASHSCRLCWLVRPIEHSPYFQNQKQRIIIE